MDRRILTIAWVTVICIAIAGCGGIVFGNKRLTPTDTHYKVKKGDTLYAIAWKFGQDFKSIATWNDISIPYSIYPGQSLRVTPTSKSSGLGKSPAKVVVKKRGGSSTGAQQGRDTVKVFPRVSTRSKPGSTQTPSPTKRAPAKAVKRASTDRAGKANKPATSKVTKRKGGKLTWGWPAKGKVTTAYSPSKGSKGIDIGGRTGQSIYSAADGDVVYSGKGLIGYGNLIIVKHSEVYLSAYGHNKRLVATEGDSVKKGEKIAEMGTSNSAASVLHFEIRKYGKPVDPMKYLPKKVRGGLDG